MRLVYLPAEVQAEKATATLKNGVLPVVVPKGGERAETSTTAWFIIWDAGTKRNEAAFSFYRT